VTHDQVEALALADRVAVMANAVLQQFGTRDELYHRPANRFVADFIGEPPTNFFEATAAGEGTGARLLLNGGGASLTTTAARGALLRKLPDGRVVLGIRPQNLTVAPRPGTQPLTAIVALNEYLGEQSILTLEAGGAVFRALAPPDADYARGQPVTLHYKPDDVMVFDPRTDAFIG
jgi:multiple sugar transport system ATP-binding protein